LLVPWLIGLGLSALQVCLFTGFAPVFHSTELPYQLLTVSFLAGHALGYAWRERWLWPLALLCTAAPVLVVGMRGFSPALDGAAERWALPAGAAAAALMTAALAHLTVQWWQRCEHSSAALARLYSAEMLGSACGLLLASLLGVRGMLDCFPYLATLAFAGCGLRRIAGAALGLAVLQSVFLARLENWSVRRVYASPAAGAMEVLERAYSPYQLIEVISYAGQPYLFLNGLCHHNPRELVALNYYLAELPAQLLDSAARDKGVLVLGAGALLSPAETTRRGLQTTVVELDAKVLEVSARQFAPRFGLDLHSPLLNMVADDARHYAHQPRQFGLIVFSLPYPYSLNVASLFTREFFGVLSQRLSGSGCMAIFLGLSSRETALDPVAAAILRALRQVFPHAVGIRSRDSDNMVVLVRKDRPWELSEVDRVLTRDRRYGYRLLAPRELDNLAARAKAASLWDLRTCGWLNLRLWFGS
jgi:spermidine synthase